MDYSEVIRSIAMELGLLAPSGDLVQFDSLALVDFIVRLEDKVDVMIPPRELTAENFASIAAVQALLTRARAAAA